MSSNFHNLYVRPRQRGAALIVALVVVLLVVLLATRLSSDYLVLFRTVENQDEVQQARAYLRGAELVASEALLRDLQANADVDSTLEPWAQRADLPVPAGLLSACLDDLQGRLNLNDLVAPAGTYGAAQKRFIRLLQVVDADIDSVDAVALANAVFDWLDADDTPRHPGGAETLDYLRLPQPYRAANQAFASASELRLVQGFDQALVAALTPHVSVWGNGNLNLNTLDARLIASTGFADANPVMLRTLNTADTLLPLGSDAARLLAAARNDNGGYLENLEMFARAPFSAQTWELDGLATSSEYFELHAVLQGARRAHALTTVLRRSISPVGMPQVSVVSRRYGDATTGSASCASALH